MVIGFLIRDNFAAGSQISSVSIYGHLCAVNAYTSDRVSWIRGLTRLS
jgi:hypothetical protein